MSDLQSRLARLSPAQRALLEARLRDTRADETQDSIPPRPAGERAALSFAQQRLWLVDQLQPGGVAYNITAALRLHGPLRTGPLEQALRQALVRHEVLRTVYRDDQGEPWQEVLPPPPFELRVVAVDDAPAAQDAVARLAATPFDLRQGPMLRALLLQLGQDDHVLALVVHHIAADGWSLSQLTGEIAQDYTALREGRPTLPPPALQYADFASWQRGWLRGNRLQQRLATWRQRLQGVPALELAMAAPRPAVQSFAGGAEVRRLPPALAQAAARLGQEAGASLFMVLMAAFQVLLQRHSGQDDFAVGTPVANRTRRELETLVGFLVNMLPLRAQLAGRPTFCAVLEHVRATAVEAYANQDVPFERLVEEIAAERDLSRTPVFQVVLAFQNTPPVEGTLAGVRASPFGDAPPISRFDLELHIAREGDALHCLLQYDTALFDAAQVRRLLAQYEEMLGALTARPDVPLDTLVMLAPGERDIVVPRAFTADDAFEPVQVSVARQIATQPGAAAVTDEHGTLTYGELGQAAGSLAARLRSCVRAAEPLIGICLPRSSRAVVSQLAVLQSGAAFVSLDPAHPPGRLAAMVHEAGCVAVIADAALWPALRESGVALLEPTGAAADVAPMVVPPATAAVPAYVIFTSGSTGKPKGVVATHGGLAHLCRWHLRTFDLDARSRASWIASPAFDASVWEVWPALVAGAHLRVVPQETVGDAPALAALLRRAGITHCFAPTVLVPLLLQQDWPADTALRWLLAGGDRLAGGVPPGLPFTLVNNYGPTEATVVSTSGPVEVAGLRAPSIGRAVGALRCHVLNARLQPLGIGQPGELFIGGPGLARGYLHQPGLTAERFVPDPFMPGERLYRTGDLACWREDGQLDFLGRRDAQLQLRGHRVEPEEVRAVLCAHPDVADAHAVAVTGPDGQPRMAAYWVPRKGAAIGPRELSDWLAGRLPAYMVPSALLPVAGFPLTPNGKLDRRALPPIAWGGAERTEAPAPDERWMATLWQEVLRVPSVGRDDNFFALGGHSLLAAQLVAHVRERTGMAVPLAALFRAPRFADFVREVGPPPDAAHDEAVLAPAGEVVLSAGQQRWWLQQSLAGQADLGAHIAAVIELRGALDVARLHRALREVMRRHEPLRTVIAKDAQGDPQGRLLDVPDVWPLPVEEVDSDADAQVRAEAEARLAFTVDSSYLLRTRLLRLSPDRHRLVATVHHMAADGWSVGVLVRELGALYAGEALEPLALRYSDVAAWQQAQPMQQQLQWWRDQLDDLPALELPTPRGVAAADPVTCSHTLSPAVTQLLAQREREGLTAFMVMQAAVWVLLSRLSGQRDFALGTPVANRSRASWEPLIGFFVNTVVLRSPLALAGETVQSLWDAVRDRTLEALAHQELPFDALVRELQPARQGQRNPFFDVLFAVQNAPQPPLQLLGLEVLGLPSPLAASRLPLEIHGVPHADGQWSLVATAQPQVLGDAGCRRLLAQLEAVLQRMLQAPQGRWDGIDVLDAGSAREVARLEAGPAIAGTQPWLDALWSHANSTAAAYVSDDGSLSFAELCTQAARWANRLREAGVGRQVPVGVLLERSAEHAVLTLAVWWAGGVYVPLDPRWPQARLAQLLQASGITLVVGRGDVLADLHGVRCWDLATKTSGATALAPANRHADDGLYLLFTSGSTGTPKAVLVPDRVLHNLCAWQAATTQPQRTLQFAALGFDVAIQELLSAWTQGQAVVGVPEAQRGDAQALLAAIRRHGAQRLFLPVVMLHELAEAALLQPAPTGLREIITAGEALRVTPAVRAWAQRERFALHNQYGPTESHVVSALVLQGDANLWPERPPIGQPIANARLRVVDAGGASLPIGWEGELWIEGPVLAHGYAGQPGLTAERFVAAPHGQRAYRTGDRCVWGEDGQLHYLGRGDQQVKVRGFRVELGEVEAQLRALPQVRQAVVVLQQGDLAAYVEPHDGAMTDALAVELRAQLARQLPAFMVPGRWCVMPSLPRNANGKLQRRQLPHADSLQASINEAQPPQGATEEALAHLWAQLLELPVAQVGRTDDFFALGGHSLKATQLATRIARDLGATLPLAQLFEQPVLADMAAAIDAARPHAQDTLPAMERADRGMALPLSFAQERLWFLDQLSPGQAAYNMPAALRLRGRLDIPALQRTFAELVRRHESLRTSFASSGGQAVQRIAPAPATWPIATEDVQDLAQAKALAIAEAELPFDLRQAPLLRTRLLRLADDDHVLLATLHHITADGWSLGVLVRELSALYAAFAQGEAPALPPLERQYADFAVWQRQWLDQARLQQELAYWGTQLADLPVLELPTDRPRPATQSHRGASCTRQLPASLAQSVQQLAQRHHATPFMVLMAAWQALLARISGQDDIAVGTALANRLHPHTEPMIGFFVNSLVLRTSVQDNPSFDTLVQRVRATALDAYAHQAVPFEKVVEHLQPARDPSRHPLFQVAFTLQNAPPGELRLHELTLAPFDAAITAARFDLEVHVWAHADGFTLMAVHATDLWDTGSVAALLAQFETLLLAAVTAPAVPMARHALATQDQQRALAGTGWGVRDDGSPDCVHRRFAAVAAAQPHATAVVCGDTRLSYCELDILANRIAQALRMRGIAPEQRVAIHLERSCELVAAILGVWKAGGAYVPLDPLQPAQRLARILADSRPVLRLTRGGALAHALPQDACPVLDLAGAELERLSSTPPVDTALPRHLAYVLYTSGSTGEPKGVLAEHAGVDNLQRAQIRALGLHAGDRALLFASIGFDASVSELCLGLLSGAALVIADAAAARSVEALADLLVRDRVSVATLTPSLLAALPGDYPDLRVLLTAGEPCPLPVAQRWSAGRHLVNAYGPTETTVAATMGAPIDPSAMLAPALGAPIDNVFTCVLDADGQLLPDGVPGELCVGGAGVARGYRGQPGLTASRFIPDAWSGVPGARLYRTGDKVVRHANGRLAYLGRLDQQLKIRGQRAEPGEIEAALRRHPDVVDAAVALATQPRGDAADLVRVAPTGGAVEWWPSIAEHFVYDATMYHAMTHDEVRNAHYRVAFEAAVPGRTVVDVGTGADAILARMCVEAGARHVYAIERLEASWRSASATVERLGLSDRITVIHGDATTVQLPGPVDLCVSEIVGPIGGAEGSAVILNEAWRFLRPGGRMIPSRTVSRVAAVELPAEALEHPAFNPLTAEYTRRIFAQAGGPFDLRLCVKGLSSADLLSDSAVFEDLDHEAGRVPLEATHAIELTVARDGFCAGLLVWLQLHATPAQCLDTLDVTCCWLPVYLPAFGNGMQVAAGTRIRCNVIRTLAANGLNPDFVVDGEVQAPGAAPRAFRFESPHGPALGSGAPRLRATPFYQRLFRAPDEETQRLVAWVATRYAQPQAAATEAALQEARVADWRNLYESTIDTGVDDDVALSGWNSSYTGDAIPAHEMRAWRDATVQRIRQLGAQRIWEVGCGNGLLLWPLAPGCASYRGTDFSAPAIAALQRRVAAAAWRNVTLDAGEAAQVLRAAPPGCCDAIVLNSVVQYFPGLAYLSQVLADAVRVLSPGGTVFVGDVRGRHWLEAFHASVARSRKQDAAHARTALAAEEELTVDPAWFTGLSLPGLAHVELRLKDEDTANELTWFRYDVVLHVGPAHAPRQAAAQVAWADLGASAALEAWLLTHRGLAAACTGVPNARVLPHLRDAAAMGLRPATWQGDGMDPAALRLLAARCGATARIAPAASGDPALCDVLFEWDDAQRAAPWERPPMRLSGPPANNPLRKRQEDLLREQLPQLLRMSLPDALVPSAYVLVDALPLTASGKVDRRALPAPATIASRRASTLPRDATEAALAALWQDVLGIDQVGRDEDFFLLGGHSLLAVQLMARIRERFGMQLPLALLLQHGTVAALAERLRGQGGSAGYTPLVPLRPAGDRPPLFFVHPGGGGPLCYRPLVDMLPPAWPAHGLQPAGLEPGEVAVESMQAMAATYVAAIRALHPHGPYHLVGWSFGGHVAYEMACQLRAQGCEVARLVLVDAMAPEHVPKLDPRLQRHDAQLAYLAQLAGLDVTAGMLAPLAEAAQVALVAERAAAAGILPAGSADTVARMLKLSQVSGMLSRSYQPGHFDGTVHFLRAAEAMTPELAEVARREPAGSWDRYAAHVDVQVVPGDHRSVLLPPNLGQLAATLRQLLPP